MAISDLDKDDLQAYDEQIVDIRESLYQTLNDKLGWAQEDNKRILSMMALVNALAVLIATTTLDNEEARITLEEQFIKDLRKGVKWRCPTPLH